MQENFAYGVRNTAWNLVCYTAVFSVVTQRSSPGEERDDTKIGCVADYLKSY